MIKKGTKLIAIGTSVAIFAVATGISLAHNSSNQASHALINTPTSTTASVSAVSDSADLSSQVAVDPDNPNPTSPAPTTTPTPAPVSNTPAPGDNTGTEPGDEPAPVPAPAPPAPVVITEQHIEYHQSANNPDQQDRMCVTTHSDGSITEMYTGGRSKSGVAWLTDDGQCPTI